MSTINDSRPSWIDYWTKDGFWKDSLLWKINSELFFRRVAPIVGLRKDDSVLDIGCGSGHLELFLAPVVKSILAVDVAEGFLESCRKRCENCDNVNVATLGTDYTDLSVFGRSFSLILAVSVVQYYKNISEIEALITSAGNVSLPGARMLIADMPLRRGKSGFVWDALCSCALSIRERYLWTLLHTAFIRWTGGCVYKSFCNEVKTLDFTTDELKLLIQRMGLKARIIRTNLSVYANRPGLLIQF
jgi:ubiquinone/menaquinone biosynthesis C-methylase UbiE